MGPRSQRLSAHLDAAAEYIIGGANAEEKPREPELKRDLPLQSNLRVNLCSIVKLDERRREALPPSFICKRIFVHEGTSQDRLASHTTRISGNF